MMAVQFTKRGSLEDLCSRCRTYVYYDLVNKNDDSQGYTVAVDNPDPDDLMVYDRNHETLGFLDEAE